MVCFLYLRHWETNASMFTPILHLANGWAICITTSFTHKISMFRACCTLVRIFHQKEFSRNHGCRLLSWIRWFFRCWEFGCSLNIPMQNSNENWTIWWITRLALSKNFLEAMRICVAFTLIWTVICEWIRYERPFAKCRRNWWMRMKITLRREWTNRKWNK